MNTDVTGFGAVLADAMGLGKTLQCIALIWALLKHGPYGNKPVLKRVIIVTPGTKRFRSGETRLQVQMSGKSRKGKEWAEGKKRRGMM